MDTHAFGVEELGTPESRAAEGGLIFLVVAVGLTGAMVVGATAAYVYHTN